MIAGAKQNLLLFFRKRRLAYLKVFDTKSPVVKEVLADLSRFCRAHQSTFHPDQRIHAQLEGRREVLLRILEQLNLTEDELYELHVARNIKPSD